MVKAANFSAKHYFNGRRWFGAFVLAFAVLASVSTAMGQAGQLDKTFANGGIFLAQSAGLSNTQATAVALQGDGKIVVAGQGPSQMGSPQPAVLRITANGALDTSFGRGGLAIVNLGAGGGEFATGVVIQTDGKIVIGVSFGNADGVAELELARLNADGTLDTSFGSGGTVQVFRGGPDTTYVDLQPDGKILVGGGLLMARVNPDGSLDTSFGQKGIAPLVAPSSSIVLQSNGQILAMTNGSSGGSPSDGGFVRYNANGSVDSTFGTQGRTASVVGTSAALLQGNGQIVAVGPIISKALLTTFPAATFNTDFGVVRYGSNGTIDTSFGKHGLVLTDFSNTAPFAVPNSLVIESKGDIIAAGQATQSSSPASSFALTRYTPKGALDTTFGSGGKVVTAFGTNSAGIAAVTLDSDGRLVAVGNLDTPGTPNSGTIVVARYLTQ